MRQWTRRFQRCEGARIMSTTISVQQSAGTLKFPAATLSDALVFFGATGDLAHKQIFPALQQMIRRGNLNVPVIGVAKAGWTIDQLRARARDSIAQHGGVDEAAFAKLVALLQYIDGDCKTAGTFEKLRQALGQSQCPAH